MVVSFALPCSTARARSGTASPRSRLKRPGKQKWVDSIKPINLLLGRGSGPSNHKGNMLFRKIVKKRKADYAATNHRQTKHKIAKAVVDDIQEKGGRFLRKATDEDMKIHDIPKGIRAWCAVDEASILEKAKQALRQKKEYKDPSQEESMINQGHLDADETRPRDQTTENPVVLPTRQSTPVDEDQEPLDWREASLSDDEDDELTRATEILFGLR